ncbi:SixA phosphatase family protein [Actinacidiphila glaucinigra]|uniref:Phosphohistidine phosphatase n=1 Tax=Actinacidiphila glaucinigra TaxID=235986 RepID=A0A239LKJ2_9ACTN|nr:histidine phosphatase family protein [Actinacidiphila glaucinigra]SNT30991.1 phosphohistidine phosphatase [Actinacidiphila glaucinigra]
MRRRAEGARRLVVLRHAKSAWPPDVPDHDRPLGPRGRRDAPAVGRWLRDAGHTPDLVICSTSRRTQETWEFAAAALGARPPAPVRLDERVYAATARALLDVLREAPEEASTLLLVGHNPGVQDLVLRLTGEARADALLRAADKFPTSALAVLTWPAPWSSLTPEHARLDDFAVPRG